MALVFFVASLLWFSKGLGGTIRVTVNCSTPLDCRAWFANRLSQTRSLLASSPIQQSFDNYMTTSGRIFAVLESLPQLLVAADLPTLQLFPLLDSYVDNVVVWFQTMIRSVSTVVCPNAVCDTERFAVLDPLQEQQWAVCFLSDKCSHAASLEATSSR